MSNLFKTYVNLLLIAITSAFAVSCAPLQYRLSEYPFMDGDRECLYARAPISQDCIFRKIKTMTGQSNIKDLLRNMNFICKTNENICTFDYVEKYYSIDYSNYKITHYKIHIKIKNNELSSIYVYRNILEDTKPDLVPKY